jgi:hypothetical protein
MLEVRLSIGDDGEVTLTQTLTLVLTSPVGQPWTASSLLVRTPPPARLDSPAEVSPRLASPDRLARTSIVALEMEMGHMVLCV